MATVVREGAPREVGVRVMEGIGGREEERKREGPRRGEKEEGPLGLGPD